MADRRKLPDLPTSVKADTECPIGIIKGFIGKCRYPALTIYDERRGHHVTKLHPILKILIVIESIAIVHFASFLMLMPWGYSVLHLLAAYWFVLELVVHVGIIELDPNAWKYHKAIFRSGKEGLSDKHFVKVIEKKR